MENSFSLQGCFCYTVGILNLSMFIIRSFPKYLVACLILLFFGLFFGVLDASAANRYWVGASTTFNTTGNWSTSSGGASGASVPGSSDIAIFDGGSAQAVSLDATTLSGLDIQAAYGGTVTAPAGTLILMVSFSDAAGAFVHNNGTVQIRTGSGAYFDFNSNAILYNLVSLNGANYGNRMNTFTVKVTGTLTHGDGSSSGGIWQTGTLRVEGDFTVAKLADTYQINNGTGLIQFTGSNNQSFTTTDTTDTFGAPVEVNKTSGTLTLNSAFDFTGASMTFTVTAGTVDMSTSSMTDVYNLYINGGTFIHGSGTLTTKGTTNALQVNGGTFTGGSGDVNFASGGELEIDSGTFTAPTGNLALSSTLHVASAGATFNHNNGTITSTTSTHLNIEVEGGVGTITVYNLTLNKAGGYSLSVNGSSTLVVQGTLTRTAGRLSESSSATYPLQIEGNLDFDAVETNGTSTLLVTGSGTQTLDFADPASWDTNIFVNKSGGSVSLLTGLTLNAASNNNLTIQEGRFNVNGQTLSVGGTLSVESGGDYAMTGDESAPAPTLASGSIVTYVATSGARTIKDYDYSASTLAFDGVGGVFIMTVGGETVANLTITNGSFYLNGDNLTVTGTFSNDDTLILSGDETTVSYTNDTDSGTVEYKGAVTAASLKGGNSYYNLAFVNPSGSWTAAAPVDINGSLTVTSGTFNTGGYAVTLAGNFTNAATFTQSSGTLTLDGTNQTLSGSTTFYNLTKNVSSAATLTFTAGQTFTVSNNLDLQGASGQVLSLVSSTPTTAINMSAAGTVTAQYLNVSDNNNTGSTINCVVGCVKGTGNTGWMFASSATPSSVTYQDTDVDGVVDRVIIDFGSAVSIVGTLSNTRFTWVSSTGANGFGGSLTGNASVVSGDVVITITGSETDDTSHTTQPTLAYSDNSTDGTNYIADASGDLILTFGATNAADGASPILVSSNPADADTSVANNATIALTFSEPINTGTFAYSCCGVGTDPGRSGVWTVSNTVYTVTPTANWTGGNTITIDITTSADTTGNAFGGAGSGATDPFTFTVARNTGGTPTPGAGPDATVTTAQLIAPNGGEQLVGGQIVTISWSASGDKLTTIKLTYTLDQGRTYKLIAENEENDGEYRWTVPNITAAAVYARVSGITTTGGELVSDGSNANFSVIASADTPIENVDDIPSVPVDTSTPVAIMQRIDGTFVELRAGNLFRGETLSGVYLVRNGKRYVFPSESVYFSYYDSFSNIVMVKDSQLKALDIGGRVTMAPGRMIKIQSDNHVYQVQEDGTIRHIPDEATARSLYGDTWNKQITDINVTFWFDYPRGDALTT